MGITVISTFFGDISGVRQSGNTTGNGIDHDDSTSFSYTKNSKE